MRESDRRRLKMRGVFRLVIGHGRAVAYRAAAADRSGLGENRLDERRLPGVVRSDESDIPQAPNFRQCSCPLSRNDC
jgi:hypothetical protein